MYLVKVPTERVTLEKGEEECNWWGRGKDEAGGAIFLFLAAATVREPCLG